MEEMTLRVPVAIKSKVTDTLKNKIIADLQQQMDMVDQDLQQIEFQAKRLLSEQAKIDAQGLIQLRQQIEEEKQQRVAFTKKIPCFRRSDYYCFRICIYNWRPRFKTKCS